MILRSRRRSPNAGPPATTRIADGGLLAAGSLLLALARLVVLAAGLVFAVIALAVVLRLLDANAANSLVRAVHDAGRALVGPFDGMFRIRDARESLAVNWGVAAVVYLFAGSLLARILRAPAVGALAARPTAGRRWRDRRASTER